MERRFKVRLQELLDDAVVDPAVFQEVLPRLKEFVRPFAESFAEGPQRQHVEDYVGGLVSNLERKNMESIAYLRDRDRQGLQKFIGQAPWDHRPLVRELARQVGAELGEADGVIVFDPSAFPKKGKESVGVDRQWCGRLGKVDNCQVGVYMGYVSRREHTLVDFRLYLNEAWAKDKKRRKKCGVPKAERFRTRHRQSLEMLGANGPLLPHGWVAGDDEFGRSSGFRRDLRAQNERYLLAVPSNTLVRDLDAEPPPYSGRGPRPKPPFVRVDRLCAALSKSAWTMIEVRPGEKGPLTVEAVKVRVAAKTDRRRIGPEEILVVFRERQADGSYKLDYCLSNAAWETPLAEFAWVLKAQHRIEECLQRAKSDTGLAHYEVRTWFGWHHHQTLSILAAWFLNQETRRGKKMDAGDHGPPAALVHRLIAPGCIGLQPTDPHLPHEYPTLTAHRAGPIVLLENSQPPAPLAG